MDLIIKYRFPQQIYLSVALSILRDEYKKSSEDETIRVNISKAIQDLEQQLGFQRSMSIG